MLTKKMTASLALLAAAATVSAPALAERGQRYGHGYKVVKQPVVKQHYVVKHRPVVQHYHYRPAPRPVVVYHQPVYQPAPVYYSSPNHGAALFVGAVLGAAVAHHVFTSY